MNDAATTHAATTHAATTDAAMIDVNSVDWDKLERFGGLVPAIVQHAVSGGVLMLGFMNREALAATLARGRVVFFSRSKQRLWEKGETSGNVLAVRAVRIDCDADTLLISAEPSGPVCHTGTATCFGDAPLAAAERFSFLAELQQLITRRVADNPQGSYTARLYAQGLRRMAQKVGEEGVEVALAAVDGSDQELIGECADLLYHLMVVLRGRSLPLESVVEELARRHRQRQGEQHR